MKTRLTFLTTAALPLVIALVTPSSALAQANGASKAPPAASRGREAIMEKLENIRLQETPKPWEQGIPLAEVVRGLSDEAKARDPDKKGINFLLVPTQPQAAAAAATDPTTGLPVATPTAPPVAEDIGSYNIKIAPPLRDLRLMQVLDVITKTSDKPLKYSVEDYGVLFAAKENEAVGGPEVSFSFPGGTPRQFMEAVEKQFKADWLSIASIPREMEQVRVPKLRFAPKPGVHTEPVGQLVLLYNNLAERNPQLGTLLVTGDPSKPSAVLLVPDKSGGGAAAQTRVRVFPVRSLTKADWGKLMDEIARTDGGQIMMWGNQSESFESSAHGEISIHPDTALLVAKGTEYFVELADSIVTAFRANLAAKEAKPQTEAVKSPTEKK